MRRLIRFCWLGALCVISACAMTPGGMRQDPDAKSVAVVDVGYQLALKRIVDNHRECMPPAIVPIGQAIFDVQNYNDLRTASITIGATGVGTQIHRVIDLREIEGKKTELTVYSKIRLEAFAKFFQQVAEGRAECFS